ncbi:MAG: hypothetical protein RLZ91_1085, partial [Bacteroidota bacterium]
AHVGGLNKAVEKKARCNFRQIRCMGKGFGMNGQKNSLNESGYF